MVKIVTKTICAALILMLCSSALFAQKERSDFSKKAPIMKHQTAMSVDKQKVQSSVPRGEVIFWESFEDADFFDLPYGWTEESFGEGWWWFVDDDDFYGVGLTGHTGLQWATVWVDEYDRDAWLYSPGISLTQGVEYTISFWIIMGFEEGDGDNLEVKIGEFPTVSSMNEGTTVFYAVNECYGVYDDVEWYEVTYNFTPATTGTYYLGFHVFTPALDGFDVLLDDVLITKNEEVPEICDPVTNLTGEYNDDCEAVLTWNAPEGSELFNIYRDDELIAEEITGTTYVDDEVDSSVIHTWSVIVVCEEDISEAAIVVINPCSVEPEICDPVTNLEVEYTENCEAVLTWDAPEGAELFNIYRDGEFVAKVEETTYTDVDFDAYTGHFWIVTVVCGEEESEIAIVELSECKETGISTLSGKISIYPNPARNLVYIEGANIVKVEIYNMLGQLIDTQRGKVNSIDVSKYNIGTYLFKAYDVNNNSVITNISVTR